MKVIEIPIHPHVKSLLLSLYGAEPVRVQEDMLTGTALKNILLSVPKPNVDSEPVFGHTVTLQVSPNLIPFYKSYSSLLSLGVYFQKEYNEILYAYIEGQRDAGISMRQAIVNFYEKYKINDEFYEYHSSESAYLRLKKKRTM